MKKFLSLALAAIMLLSTLMFTSCDVNSIMEMLGGNFGSVTTPAETTPAETTPPAPKRYTITEAEWEAILNSTNYTIKSSYDSNSVEYFMGDNAVCMTSKKGDISNTAYLEKKNGKIYEITDPNKNGQWVAFEYEDFSWDNVPSLGKQTGLGDSEFFEKLQYNEATKSYIGEEDGDKAEFFFEDGKLIKATITDGTHADMYLVIKNVGTTVVTVPQYKMKDELEEEENEETYIPQGTMPPPAIEETAPTTDGSN
jgi:hypothetical protein